MKILAIIPARGGSKGIPRKNIIPVAGKPLIAWRIDSARACSSLDRVIVSTEDEEIAAVAQQYGAEVPFIRPAELAQDTTPGIDPVLHALSWLQVHDSYIPDYVMLLQPTSPLCQTSDLDGAVALMRDSNAEAVVSVTPAHPHPYWMKEISPDGHLIDFAPQSQEFAARQSLPPVYSLNGAIYLTATSVLQERRSFYAANTLAYVMPPERSIDIDALWELKVAEFLLRTNNP